jgi:hypothetical protein
MSERYCVLCVDDDVSGLEARAALLEEEGRRELPVEGLGV